MYADNALQGVGRQHLGAHVGVAQKVSSPLDRIEYAVRDLSNLEERVMGLTVKLVGQECVPPSEPAISPAAELPVIDAIGSAGFQMSRTISRINDALNAINAKLP